jgi:hypothetical protein
MSADRKLPRWSEQGSEAPAELRQWLRASREQLAAGDEVAQLSRGLAERLGSELGLAPARAPALAGKAWLAAGRWALWLSVGAGSVAAVWYWQSEKSVAQPAFVPPLVQPSVVQPASAAAPPTVGARAELAAVVPLPDAARTATPEPPRARALPKAPRTSEAELLRRAQRALVDHPSQALALTAEHRRRYAEGALTEEREVIAIEALRRLGREQAAQARAAAFEAKYRNSVHRSRVQATPAAQ